MKYKKFIVEYPVEVEIEWPENIPCDPDSVVDIAMSSVVSVHEVNIGPPGRFVWAKCHAEVQQENAEIVYEESAGG